MKIKIEVGANRGTETKELASDDSIVYAFEPTYELLAEYLWPLSYKNKNIRILPFAVDCENSFKKFNVAGHWDWGCSSLYEFSDNLNETWPGRVDFSNTHSYIVPTITLYDFCELYKIDTIDFLHIDAQGNDFNVLKSLKDKISIVKEGVIEASKKVELYKNTNNKVDNIKEYLKLNGFEIINETINDAVEAEVNIYFKKI
jgi:FkbM family methyltransferase